MEGGGVRRSMSTTGIRGPAAERIRRGVDAVDLYAMNAIVRSCEGVNSIENSAVLHFVFLALLRRTIRN